MPNAAKIHPEDILIAQSIAKAIEFSAFYRNGPHEKYKETGFETYGLARIRADKMAAEHSKFGRGAIVYAITKEGYSLPCDEKLMALAYEFGAAQ